MHTEYQEIPGMPDRPSLPVLVEASYDLADDQLSAVLRLKGNNAHSLQLAIIHEKRRGQARRPSQYNIHGDEACDLLETRDGECLIILARTGDEVIACGLFQVNLGLYESIASVLLHVVVNNLEVIPCAVGPHAPDWLMGEDADLEKTIRAKAVEVAR